MIRRAGLSEANLAVDVTTGVTIVWADETCRGQQDASPSCLGIWATLVTAATEHHGGKTFFRSQAPHPAETPADAPQIVTAQDWHPCLTEELATLSSQGLSPCSLLCIGGEKRALGLDDPIHLVLGFEHHQCWVVCSPELLFIMLPLLGALNDDALRHFQPREQASLVQIYDLRDDQQMLQQLRQKADRLAWSEQSQGPIPGSPIWWNTVASHRFSGIISWISWGAMMDDPTCKLLNSLGEERACSRRGDRGLYCLGLSAEMTYVEAPFSRSQRGSPLKLLTELWIEESHRRTESKSPGLDGAVRRGHIQALEVANLDA